MALRKPKPDPTPSEEVLAELDERLRKLSERKRAAVNELIAVETSLAAKFGKLGVAGLGTLMDDGSDLPVSPTLDERVARLLGGDFIPTMPGGSDKRRRTELHREITALDRAIDIGGKRLVRERVAAAAEVLARGTEAWRQNLREIALAAARLRRLNAERDVLRDEILVGLRVTGDLPLESYHLNWAPLLSAAYEQFFRGAVLIEVVTEEELAKC